MGGKSQPAPDYRPLAEIQREQLAFSKQQYAEMKPLLDRVAGSQIAAQEQQMQQAKDYYDYNVNTFRPLEQGLVKQAQEFDTAGYREQLASQAAADTARAFGTAQGMTNRDLARRGVGPGSGNALAMGNQNALALASARAGAATGTRNQAEQTGWARKMDVTGLGRNLAGASTAAYQSATGAGTAGANTSMAAGDQYQRGLSSSAATGGTILNNQTSQFNAGLSAEGQVIGGLVGAGSVLGAAAI